MLQETVEEYLSTIYRLRTDPETPLPLSRLSDFFGFSPVSIHEMIQKLNDRGWVRYHPYRGVLLTESGEEAAQALLRRHRLWERFLTDILEIPWDDAHRVAGSLEHAATDLVMERLAAFLGQPDSCPHGAPIPPAKRSPLEQCLRSLPAGTRGRIARIAPETPQLLARAADLALVPGRHFRLLAQEEDETRLILVPEEAAPVSVSARDAAAIWVEVL